MSCKRALRFLLAVATAALFAAACGSSQSDDPATPPPPAPIEQGPESPAEPGVGTSGGMGDATSDQASSGTSARAQLQGRKGSGVSGTVMLEKTAEGVKLTVNASGLTPGKHGFHIHEKGDCSAADFKSAGGHFNPKGTEHGAPDDAAHHHGDFGNLVADQSGNATATMMDTDITLDDSESSVIGKAFIIHEKADDLKSQPSGAAGSRIACGVIEAQGADAGM